MLRFALVVASMLALSQAGKMGKGRDMNSKSTGRVFHWLTQPGDDTSCFKLAKAGNGDLGSIGDLRPKGRKDDLACQAVLVWKQSVADGHPEGSHRRLCVCLFRMEDHMPNMCSEPLDGKKLHDAGKDCGDDEDSYER